MTKINKALMASTAIALASGLAMPASAQDPSAAPGVVHSQKKLKLRLYGQITRAFGVVGDGESTTFKTGENGNTATRMGIRGRGKVTNDISLATRMEFSVRSGDEQGGSQFVNQGGASSRFDVRHLDVIISSKRFGGVRIGRGDSATNGTSERQLAPGMNSGRLGGSVHHVIGEFILMDEDDSLQPQAVSTVDRFFNSFDGAGRQNRIRYDTPTLFGFKGAVAFIDKDNFDASVFYSGKIAGTEIAGAIGYVHTIGSSGAGDSTGFANGTRGGTALVSGIEQVNGSVSVRTPIGLGATFSGATQWQERTPAGASLKENPTNLVPSIWYTTKLTELGATTVEYAFQYCDNCGFKGDEGRGHAVTLMQKVDNVGGDYFLGFRYIDAETETNDNIEPLWWFGGGFRQRF